MKTVITSLILFLRITTFGQGTASKEVYKILSDGNILNAPYREIAKRNLKHYISNNPTSPAGLLALYYLAEIYYSQKRTDSANPLYQRVLSLSASTDTDEVNNRHFSAIRLAEIFISQHDYCSSLNYLDLAKQRFLPRFSCGTARFEDERKMKVLYSSCYIGQGEYNKAIDSLSPYMFDDWYPNDTTLEKKLYEAYLNVYTKDEIRNEFVESTLKGLTNKTEKYNSHSYLQPTIKVFGQEIRFQDDRYDLNKLTNDEQIQKCRETIRKSRMYKLAAQ